MAGTLTIPNTIVTLRGPRQPASLLDENWDEIASYINTRQVTFDVIANRPAAGVAGRQFYATDELTLYYDNGTSWIAVAGGGAGGGVAPLPGSTGQAGAYNSGDADEFDLAADRVTVTDATGTSSHFLVSVSVTVDLTVTGAGGRDQALALSANSWAHLYYIYNPTTAVVNALASASAWPTASPTLPSGFTEFAYAGAARIGAGSQFSPMRIQGRHSIWYTAQAALTSGASATDAAISLAAMIPPNAVTFSAYAYLTATVNAGGSLEIWGTLSAGVAGTAQPVIGRLAYWLDSGVRQSDGMQITGPNIGQQMFYRVTDSAGAAPASGTNQLTVTVVSFENPNGG